MAGFDLANQHYFGLRGMRGECGAVSIAADTASVDVPTGLVLIAFALGQINNHTLNCTQHARCNGTISNAGNTTFHRIGNPDQSGTLVYLLLGH